LGFEPYAFKRFAGKLFAIQGLDRLRGIRVFPEIAESEV
jgi:hypothetical protein